jgi:hypothetical protein
VVGLVTTSARDAPVSVRPRMPVYYNVSATIHVDGKALGEYQLVYDGCRKLVSC